MSWHDRALHHPSGDLAVHEVYCEADDRPDGCTVLPATFIADASEGLEGIAGALRQALADAERRPILECRFRAESARRVRMSRHEVLGEACPAAQMTADPDFLPA